jgi:anti-sigma B factor antagonist
MTRLEAAAALDLMGIPDVAEHEDGSLRGPDPSGRSLVWATTARDRVTATTTFGVQTEVFGDQVVMALRGEMDVYSAARLRNELNWVIGQGSLNIVLDLGELDFMDSTGLGVLARAERRAQEAGGRLRLRSPRRSLQRVLEITGMAHVFSIVE